MQKWRIKVERKDMDPIYVDAFAPVDGAYVGAMRPLGRDGQPEKSGWGLVHIPTGMKLKSLQFPTREKAFEFINRLHPVDDCWRDATGKADNRATVECWNRFVEAGVA